MVETGIPKRHKSRKVAPFKLRIAHIASEVHAMLDAGFKRMRRSTIFAKNPSDTVECIPAIDFF